MSVFTNTSAVATIDGDEVNTIHASDIADTLAAYNRSTALIVNRLCVTSTRPDQSSTSSARWEST